MLHLWMVWLYLIGIAGRMEPDANQISLLEDTDFKNGFGIGNYFFSNKPGQENALKDVRPFVLKEFPENDVKKFWTFQEGVHRNFTDKSGKYIKELYEHRFNISGQLIAEEEDRLKITIYNNYDLRESDEYYNKKLVRYVDTDRSGKVEMYFNTQNLIRNEATSHEPRFKDDTWPHFLICQSIDSVEMTDYDSFPVSFNVRLLQYRKLSDRMAGGKVPEKANFLSYFRVVNKKTKESLWLGICMYTSSGDELFYKELMSVDQNGTGMYRFPVREYGGPLELGKPVNYQFDLKKVLSRALDNPKSNEGTMSPDDYVIVGFNIGWECIGDHETLIEFWDLKADAIKY